MRAGATCSREQCSELIKPRGGVHYPVGVYLKDAVTVEPLGEFTLKGIGRPLAAYNVLAAAPP
jgi:hypothetical protein